MSNSLWPHGLQHARLPCPSLSPRACLHSCPLSWHCYLTILSSATLFFFCLQSFPSLESFPMSWLFLLGDQSIGVSSSASVPSMNIQGWFPLGFTGLILQSKRLSRVICSKHAWVLSCFSYVWLFTTPWTVTHQAPLSMGFSRQEYWSGLLCHSSRGCPQPRAQTCVSCIASKLFIAESL